MARWTPDLEDRIRRTDLAGQLSIDGDEVTETKTRRRPRRHGVASCSTEQAGMEEGIQETLFQDRRV